VPSSPAVPQEAGISQCPLPSRNSTSLYARGVRMIRLLSSELFLLFQLYYCAPQDQEGWGSLKAWPPEAEEMTFSFAVCRGNWLLIQELESSQD
jgi:hypothetical protein